MIATLGRDVVRAGQRAERGSQQVGGRVPDQIGERGVHPPEATVGVGDRFAEKTELEDVDFRAQPIGDAVFFRRVAR